MNTIQSNFYAAELAYKTAEVELMIQFSSELGFYYMYQESLASSGNSAENTFECVNIQYRLLFGSKRYESYADFQRFCVKRGLVASDVALTADFLKQWFIIKGFDTWVSFKPLMLHYYPKINEDHLLAFWEAKYFEPETVKLVDFVKQIIG